MIKGITLKEIVDQTKVEAAKVFEVYNIYQTKLHNRAIDKKDYTGLFNNPIIQTRAAELTKRYIQMYIATDIVYGVKK